MKYTIHVEIDRDQLQVYTDRHLASLWHVAQANPAPMENREAGQVAELVGREIIRRFVTQAGPELWAHQGGHADWCELHLKKGEAGQVQGGSS